MLSFSFSASARYLVFEQVTLANGEVSLFKVYCDTIAEARREVNRQWQRWQRTASAANAPIRLVLSSGYKPSNVPAAMVATTSKRYGRCIVAAGTFGGGKAELGIIARY